MEIFSPISFLKYCTSVWNRLNSMEIKVTTDNDVVFDTVWNRLNSMEILLPVSYGQKLELVWNRLNSMEIQ